MLRITRIPIGSQPRHIKQRLVGTIRGLDENDVELGAINLHDQRTGCCIVTFVSFELVQKVLCLEEPSRKLGTGILNIDHHFGLITTLYSSSNPQTGKPDIE